MKRLRQVVWASLTFLTALPAYAHVPVILETDPSPKKPYVIDQYAEQSRAIFQEIRSGGDIDVYEIVLPNEMELTVQVGVPLNCETSERARPTVAVVGPGNKVISGGRGYYAMAGFYQTEEFEEEYSGFTFALGAELRVNEALQGRYRIYVWDPGGRTGHYQLNLNRSEKYFSQFLNEVRQACEFLVDVPREFYPACERTVAAPQCCQFGVSGGVCASTPAPATTGAQ